LNRIFNDYYKEKGGSIELNPNTRHIGTVDIAKGVIDIKDRTITGTAEIDMNTIHNINLEGDELQAVLEAHFDIDRTRWNVIYGSTRFFEHLGMHKVFDLLSFQIRMVAVR